MNKMSDVVQVSPTYRHYDKTIDCHGVTQLTNSRLKWYDIARSDQPVEPGIRDLARDFLSRQITIDGIPSAQEMGFVFLHRCGESFYFLGLCTWRNNNELWKTIFYFDVGKTEDFALHLQDERHKDTFCVWELAVVFHETLAWTTYLLSDRTDHGADTYLTTVISETTTGVAAAEGAR